MEKNHGHGREIKVVWDCDSALYDSFELKSFEQQLDSAIVTRSHSMPHHHQSTSALQVSARSASSMAYKHSPSRVISRSINRVIRTLFKKRPRHGARSPNEYGDINMSADGGYSYDLRANYGALATIPEACEKEAANSPDPGLALRMSMSERFASPAVGNLVSAMR